MGNFCPFPPPPHLCATSLPRGDRWLGRTDRLEFRPPFFTPWREEKYLFLFVGNHMTWRWGRCVLIGRGGVESCSGALNEVARRGGEISRGVYWKDGEVEVAKSHVSENGGKKFFSNVSYPKIFFVQKMSNQSTSTFLIVSQNVIAALSLRFETRKWHLSRPINLASAHHHPTAQ